MSKLRKFWAKVTRKSDESGEYAIQQVTYLDRVSDAFVLFPYGLHATLPVGQLGLLIDSKGRILMGTSAIGRITVGEGEVVLYHPGTKTKMHFKANGDLDIESANNVNIAATTVAVEGDLTVSGNVVAVGEVTGNGVDLSTHTHPYTWTDPAGSGNTSPPN